MKTNKSLLRTPHTHSPDSCCWPLSSINKFLTACPLYLHLNGSLLYGFDLLLQENREH